MLRFSAKTLPIVAISAKTNSIGVRIRFSLNDEARLTNEL
jgi:hypothetical protein